MILDEEHKQKTGFVRFRAGISTGLMH